MYNIIYLNAHKMKYLAIEKKSYAYKMEFMI